MDTLCVLCASGPEYKPEERDKEPEKRKLISASIAAVRASARGGSLGLNNSTDGRRTGLLSPTAAARGKKDVMFTGDGA